jgi:glutamate dehydrogenase
MRPQQEQACSELIDKVIAHVNEKLPPSDAKLLVPFIKSYSLSASPEDLIHRKDIDLYGAMVSHWHFFNSRRKGERKVHIYNPKFEQHGWQSTHTLIEIVLEDMPFVLESVRLVLNKKLINVHLIMHMGEAQVNRDESGILTSIYTNGARNQEPCTNEGLMFIEIDKQSEESLKKLQREIEQTLEDVYLCVNDWRNMTSKMHECLEMFTSESANYGIDKKDQDEVIALLDWLNDNHFTYLGYAYRNLIKSNGSYHWEINEEDSLGVIKKYKDKYFLKFEELPESAKTTILDKNPILIGKTNQRSTVHRPAYTDFIALKVLDSKGNIVGEHRFVGLYTAGAYNRSPRSIPILRLKVESILARSQISEKSHDGKTLLNILETLPRDDLFQASTDQLYDLCIGILHIQERQRIQLFVRKDNFARFYSCLVYVPRDRFNSALREKIQNILLKSLNGYDAEFVTRFSESILARIHFIIRYKGDADQEVDTSHILNEIINVSRTWSDNFKNALNEHFGEESGNHLYSKYKGAFPIGYQKSFFVRTAVYDVQHIEALEDDKKLGMSFYQPLDEPEGTLRFKLFSPDNPLPLSDVIPMLECMGLRVMSERPHEIIKADGKIVWINDFAMTYNSGSSIDVEALKENFQETFEQIWSGAAENDGFNKLVLCAGLNWREVAMLRAYAKYLWQIGFTFSQAYIEEVFTDNSAITLNIVELFLARFKPSISADKRNKKINDLRLQIKESLEAVNNLDEDRIIRRYVDVIMATVRTNYFQKDKFSKFKDYFSFKLDPSSIPEMPLPKPMFEIFVYSPRVEGVHLRGAKVARGGLRWSDRREDFRTEVLGLMKAQQVKNAVIVPLGAKGGFVAKQLPAHAPREVIFNEGVECYKTFIRALLDITDNLIEDKVVPPKNLVRYDGDDPYLVVAADKGTATFSDTANSISEEYNFWMGDGFASGGSAGYDHKKMGITARGAWESVKRNFRELGHDTQSKDFTVVGIGDMGGDVFGNGMLLSKHIRLIAAFNHMHIFLDPNPDSAKSFEERKRLFELPRSSWEDYDKSLISEGGGVFLRSAKFITLSTQMRELLGITKEKIIPNELIRLLLKAPVDLLWNGGIGTYVKASTEHNAEVGDRANDGLRVNGKELRCKVIGEGGNLGFTQLGRVEFALTGGMLNTDAIDNSAGVDCSDHEVNIKILFNGMVAAGDMTNKQRNQLLEEMTDEVAELVLDNNRSQTEAISVAAFNSEKNVQMHFRIMEHLEEHANLDRVIEFLPNDEDLIARQQKGKGLTRPEIAVLLAYGKTLIKGEILASDVPEDDYIAEDMTTAFPELIRTQYREQLFTHRLKRELIAMQISNVVVNDMGLGFINRLQDETGAATPEVIRCYIASREIFQAKAFRESINSLDFIIPANVQAQMTHELNRLVRRGARWFLRHHVGKLDVAKTVEQFKPKVQKVREGFRRLHGSTEDYIRSYAQKLIEQKVPEEIAIATAQMSAMFSSLDIVDAATYYDLPIDSVIGAYYAVGACLELGWFREQIKLHPVTSNWDALARAAIRDDLDRQQRNLTVAIMLMKSDEVEIEAQIEAWLAQHKIFVGRWRRMITDLKALKTKDFTMYSVALRELMELANISLMESERKRVA